MLDRHEAHNDRDFGQETPARDAARGTDRPMADREVPLPGTAAAAGTSLVIHQWLDGEASEAEARRADAGQVKMWNLVTAEADQRRRMTTPAYVAANIMAAIPAASTATVQSTPGASADASRGLPMGTAAAIGAGLFATGVVIGKLL
jgi:hypothetical protein